MPDLTSGAGWWGEHGGEYGTGPEEDGPAAGPPWRRAVRLPGNGCPAPASAGCGAGRPPARLRLGVPAYAHPLLAAAEWAELARPGVPLEWVAVNVSNGPGVRPDPAVRDAVSALRDAGVRLLGYLDTGYGHRPRAELREDARSHLSWYHVDGFFLDQVASGSGSLPYYREVVGELRGGTGGGAVVLNPGLHPYPEYADLADQLVTFDGPWSVYRWAQLPDWVDAYPAERFCHLVHGVPVQHLETVLRLARWQGAGTVFITDRTGCDPWAGLPSYWNAELTMLYR